MDCKIVAAGLFEDSGGSRKSIGAFSDALSSDVYCFSDGIRIKDEGLGISRGHPVASSTLPILRQFLVPSTSAGRRVEIALKDADLISCHVFYRYYHLWVNKMHRKYGVPYWFVPHGVLDPWVMESNRGVKQIYWKLGGQRFLEQASTVIFATKAEEAKARLNFDITSSHVIPWPVLLVDVSDRHTRRQSIRSDLKISSDAHVLIYFGRLDSMKCPLETIEALSLASKKHVHLIIVGNEDEVSLAMCEDKAEALNVGPRVHIVGPVYGDRKFDYLMAADAYISLSHRENFNHTAAESMSVGLPVILSPGNDLIGEITDCNCYFDMEGNAPVFAAEAIRLFAETSIGELHEMGNRGREWVAQNLSFEKFSKSLNNLAHRYGRKNV
jgi:glycosyltransferase involved in cell wall biosynthesis